MIFSIREATTEDAHYVMDVDIKSFDQPWSAEFWGDASGFYRIAVGTHYGTPVGMAVFGKGPIICPTFCLEMPDSTITIVKLAVRRDFRRRGLGRLLVNHVKGVAYAGKTDSVVMVAPESICVPGGNNVSGWMHKVGFTAKTVVPGCFVNFGEEEDGYLFEWSNNANQPRGT